MRKRLAYLTGIALVLALLVTPASGVAAASLTATPSAGPVGTKFVLAGSGYKPGARIGIELIFSDNSLVTIIATNADTTGSFSVTVDTAGEPFKAFGPYRQGVYTINTFSFIGGQCGNPAPGGGCNPEATTTITLTAGAAPGNPPLPATPPTIPGEGSQKFPQTDKTVQGIFLAYWQANGGLPIFGYPLTELITEKLEDGQTYTVQYFERVRMEYHRDQPDPKYQVQLGQFGRRILANVPNAPTATAARKEGYTYFDNTGHNVRPEFMAYWQANGGVDQFGYPLSEEFQQQLEDGKTYTVQYFERARFELHPENAGTPFEVQLGQFGRRILAESGLR